LLPSKQRCWHIKNKKNQQFSAATKKQTIDFITKQYAVNCYLIVIVKPFVPKLHIYRAHKETDKSKLKFENNNCPLTRRGTSCPPGLVFMPKDTEKGI
jgi:hypothetical protein